MNIRFRFILLSLAALIVLAGCSGSATAEAEKTGDDKTGPISGDAKMKAGEAVEQGAKDKAEETNSAMPSDDK